VDSSLRCNFWNSFSLQRSEMFIATNALEEPRSARSEMYPAASHPQEANTLRSTGAPGWRILSSYKHLAPPGQSSQTTFCCTSKLNSPMTNEKSEMTYGKSRFFFLR
jgi:hypothetical protein